MGDSGVEYNEKKFQLKKVYIFLLAGILIWISFLVIVRADPTAYQIFYEGFESGWENSTGECSFPSSTSLVGNFNAADNKNNTDYLWCTSSLDDSTQSVNNGTYSLLMQEWVGSSNTSVDGIWYTFNPSTACGGSACTYINVSFYLAEAGWDGFPEGFYLTEQNGSGTPLVLTYEVNSSIGATGSMVYRQGNLSSSFLTSTNVSIRIIPQLSSVLDKVSIAADDDMALHTDGQYIFSTNNAGSWVKDSAVNLTTTPSWANVTKTLNST